MSESDHELGEKSSNPKQALGVKKAPMHTLPCRPMMLAALAFSEGGIKYGTHNYRGQGVLASTYYDAALRHIMDWWEGTDIDSDSGLPHLAKAIACLVVILDGQDMQNLRDDRPYRLPRGLNISELNEMQTRLLDKYKGQDWAKPYTQIERSPND